MLHLKRDSFFNLYQTHQNETCFRGIFFFLVLYIGSLVFAGIISPFIYSGIISLASTYKITWLTYLSQKPFVKYMDRLRWIPVLLCFPWLLKDAKLWSWNQLGIQGNKLGIQEIFKNFLLGFFLVIGGIVVQIAFGGVALKEHLTFEKIATVIPFSLLGAFFISLLEEIVMRGFIFRAFYTAFKNPWIAVILASILFSYFHFAKGSGLDISPTDVNIKIGLETTWTFLVGIKDNFHFIYFLNLTLLGIILCIMYLQNKNLNGCIGFHAGLVWGMLSYGKLCTVETTNLSFWLGTKYIVNGALTSIIFGVILIFQIKSQWSGLKASSMR